MRNAETETMTEDELAIVECEDGGHLGQVEQLEQEQSRGQEVACSEVFF